MNFSILRFIFRDLKLKILLSYLYHDQEIDPIRFRKENEYENKIYPDKNEISFDYHTMIALIFI